ncbi:MAG: glutamate--cysteine ligase [Rhodospirillaceae bacterium]|nr:glutamate--cysteine ligase [Rhodospirillaceae bacterium]
MSFKSNPTVIRSDEIIENRNRLVEYMASGCKPKSEWRIGTEHEKFAYHLDTLRPLEYEGENGIKTLLEKLTRFGWQKVEEEGKLIALKLDDGCSITLEPAGQVELSGAAVSDIHETCKEVGTHLQQVKAVAGEMGIAFLGLGYQPKWPRDELPWMPKGRYKIMQRYMPTRGNLGLDMMQATCTVQVNLDFDSEQTMAKMFRIAMALQPVATALFANSPFKDGKPSGYLSYRSHIWTDTDPERTGILPFVFEDGFGFDRYVEYMLDVPMYFVYRNGKYIDASGQSFRDFMNAKLPALPGEKPTIADWEDHLTTAFPEVRLKKYLEMRGGDGGPWSRLCGFSALWVGLLYDDDARNAAWDLIKDWTAQDVINLRADVPKLALGAMIGGQSAGDISLDMLEIAHGGLARRGRLDGVGLDETRFLKPLFQIAETGMTAAEDLLFAYNGRWKNSVDPVFREYAY